MRKKLFTYEQSKIDNPIEKLTNYMTKNAQKSKSKSSIKYENMRIFIIIHKE